jgi:site-specific DNA-methyltransferase (adenine-specific)/modification methylase
MVDMQDKEFDLAITSPPYNMNLRVNHKGDGYCSRQIVDELSTKYHGYDDNLPMEEYEEFIDSVLAELIRVSEIVFFNIQMITGNKPALFKLIGKYSDLIKEVAIWDKGHAQPAIGKGCMNSRYEFVIIFGGRPITRSFDCANFKRGGLDNLWEIKKERSKVDGHGASYPVSLVNHILDNFGEKGQRVIDPFLGTFTTAIACHHKGFRLTGSEVNQNYYKLGVDRVKRETAQMELI